MPNMSHREPNPSREPEVPVIHDPEPEEPKVPEMPPPVPDPPEVVGLGYGSEEGYYRSEAWAPASWRPHAWLPLEDDLEDEASTRH